MRRGVFVNFLSGLGGDGAAVFGNRWLPPLPPLPPLTAATAFAADCHMGGGGAARTCGGPWRRSAATRPSFRRPTCGIVAGLAADGRENCTHAIAAALEAAIRC